MSDNNKDINENNLEWSGSPSQWYNFPKFAIWGFITLLFLFSSPNFLGGLIAALIPLAVIVWNYLEVMMWKIEINEEKLSSFGILGSVFLTLDSTEA